VKLKVTIISVNNIPSYHIDQKDLRLQLKILITENPLSEEYSIVHEQSSQELKGGFHVIF